MSTDCNVALRDGVFNELKTSQSSYASLLLIWKFSSMSYSEAKKEIKAGAKFPYDNVPFSADFSENQFDQWKRDVQKSLHLQQINQNSQAILQLVASKDLLENWRGCVIANKKGLNYTVKDNNGDGNVVIVVEFVSPVNRVHGVPISQAPVIHGGQWVDKVTEKCFSKGQMIQTGGIIGQIVREPGKPITFTMGTEGGTIDAYIPAPLVVEEKRQGSLVTSALSGDTSHRRVAVKLLRPTRLKLICEATTQDEYAGNRTTITAEITSKDGVQVAGPFRQDRDQRTAIVSEEIVLAGGEYIVSASSTNHHANALAVYVHIEELDSLL